MGTERMRFARWRFACAVMLLVLCAVTLAGCGGGGGGSGPQFYSVQQLTQVPGPMGSMGYQINSLGQIAGYTYKVDGYPAVQQAVLWSSGTPQVLMDDSDAIAVNDLGQVLIEADGDTRVILWENGGTVDLGTLSGCTTTRAGGINNLGQVVGSADGNGLSHAFIWDHDSGMREISAAGWSDIEACDINDSGTVVGTGKLNGYTRFFLWQNGVITQIPNPPLTYMYPCLRINNPGQIIVSGNFAPSSCLYSNGAWTQLSLPGWAGGGRAHDINNSGQIVGSSYVAGGGLRRLVVPSRAILWEDGRPRDLGELTGYGDSLCDALCVNDRGQILCAIQTSDGLIAGAVILTPTGL